MKQNNSKYNNNNNNNNNNNKNNNNNNTKSSSNNNNNKSSIIIPLSASTVNESTRIQLTQKLNDIRNDEIESFTFPPTLNNTERKFLHNLSEKLGLISKSSGKGDARAITVKKRSETNKIDDKIVIFDIKPESEIILKETFSFNKDNDFLDESRSIDNNDNNNQYTYEKPRSLLEDADFIRDSYLKAQNLYEKQTASKNKKLLPAHEYQEAVCKLIKENQIILISGETGSGIINNNYSYYLSLLLIIIIINILLR